MKRAQQIDGLQPAHADQNSVLTFPGTEVEGLGHTRIFPCRGRSTANPAVLIGPDSGRFFVFEHSLHHRRPLQDCPALVPSQKSISFDAPHRLLTCDIHATAIMTRTFRRSLSALTLVQPADSQTYRSHGSPRWPYLAKRPRMKASSWFTMLQQYML
ncbi:hypothetical protein BDV96DRAFT_301619 [Lophiotrema nucula]|uniref:Uncharacterized protein n=1 Tax=Lophiotrema nucula TaxID=690887 RepID=A0A6A5YK71_9PLEO|nr:hypothetical protein BDV96DRAFT_301619 [Lophiotrema nucula]